MGTLDLFLAQSYSILQKNGRVAADHRGKNTARWGILFGGEAQRTPKSKVERSVAILAPKILSGMGIILSQRCFVGVRVQP
jgi:hypothetical protein